MSDKPNFSLPPKKQKKQSAVMAILILLCVSLIVNIIILVQSSGGASSGNAVLGPEKQKELALKLQKNRLIEPAVRAWKDYIAVANLSSEEEAAIRFSIGKLYQEGDLYAEALESFYLSEAVFPREDIAQEISRRVQTCLEYMGKFAALRYELADRVGLDETDSGSAVLAELGSEKITEKDLDRFIEESIERQISQYASFMDPESLNKQKEELFKQYSGKQEKLNMLNQYVSEEILYRRAREEKVADQPDVRALLKQTERQILAQSYLSGKVGTLVNITESDIKNYYDANKGEFIADGAQKPYESVKDEIYRKVFSAKNRELTQGLLTQLQSDYKVVLHPEAMDKGQE